MKISEMMVQTGEKYDEVLHKKGFPVNMRLFRGNKDYHEMIMEIIYYMKSGAGVGFEDYPEAQGISGANIGIPLNIVMVVTKDDFEVFLNPVVVNKSKRLVLCKTNCGSVNLPEKIKVFRHKWVGVEYYDVNGVQHRKKFEIGDANPVASATLQHEIDHNLGILVIDNEVEEGDEDEADN